MIMGEGTSPRKWYIIVAIPTANERTSGGDVFRITRVQEGLAAKIATHPRKKQIINR